MQIIIEGAGGVGTHLAKKLSLEGNDVTVIDDSSERLKALQATTDALTVLGAPASISVLSSAGVDKADLFIAVNPGVPQGINVVSALLAKQLGAKKVTARIEDESYLTAENRLIFKELGIDLLIYPEKIAADAIDDLLKHTASADSLDFARGKLKICAIKIDEDSPVIDMKVGEFNALVKAQHAGVEFRIIAISRDGKTLIPRRDTKFKHFDNVYILASKDDMALLLKQIGKEDFDVHSVMIIGSSPTAVILANKLAAEMKTVKIVEKDMHKCQELVNVLPSSVDVVNGDGRNSDFLVEESIKDFSALVALTDNDEENILTCVIANKLGVETTIAAVENTEYLHLADEMGVDSVINRRLITAGRILKFTLSDKVRFVKYMGGTEAEILEYTVSPKSRITRNPLKSTDFPQDAIIGGVIRGNEAFIAVGDTHIEAYDRVAVFALPSVVKEVESFFR